MHHKNNLSLRASDLHLLQDYIKRYGSRNLHSNMAQLNRALGNDPAGFFRSRNTAHPANALHFASPATEVFSSRALLDRFISSSESQGRSLLRSGGGKASQGQQMASLAAAITRAMTRNM